MHFALFGRRAYVNEPSPAERRILALLATEGLTNVEIAKRTHRSYGTVKRQMDSLFRKLGVTNRTSAVIRARDLGWA